MRILLSIVLAIAVIGVIIPSVYAENTIGFPFIHYPSGLDFPIIQDTIIINGHVKFENEKAVGLGLGPGYQITVQVYSSDDLKKEIIEGCTTAGIGCVDCKRHIIDSILVELKPIQQRAKDYQEDLASVENIINEGCEEARDVARDTMEEVRKVMGITLR